jgi:serine/threonine protein kinase
MKTFVLPSNDKRKQMRVKIKKKLGNGAFGVVYEIGFNGIPSALKVVDKNNKNIDLDMLRKEIDNIEHLIKKYPKCSKNLLCYSDISEDDHYIYFISDLMISDLSKFIESKPFVKLDLCSQIDLLWDMVHQIIDGLESLHRAGVIHRDIKSENILIDKKKDKYIVKIADFGISCQKKECKGFAGTPLYLSPRIVFKKKIKWTYEEDFYSLGFMLYLLFTGMNLIDIEEHEEYQDQNLPYTKVISEYRKKYKENKEILDELKIDIQQCNPSTQKKMGKMIELIKVLTVPEYKKKINISFLKKILV